LDRLQTLTVFPHQLFHNHGFHGFLRHDDVTVIYKEQDEGGRAKVVTVKVIVVHASQPS
jgi:hypothetical protein